ncbi:hypothetical protein H7373_004349 [Salmonella enterica]|nr:hypothetical protein [Salmonella enterica]
MNSSFTSHATNFVSALQTDVDPRTGQFMVNLPLARLIGNNNLGPEFSPSLSYSPLASSNAGFGTGFSLGVTQFSNLTNLLELSNGEKYRVEPGTDTVRNQKLHNFRFAYTNGNDAAEGYTVFWKEGKQEKLTAVDDSTFVTTLIVSPLGRTMALAWGWSGQYPLLNEVYDENTVLCRFMYVPSSVIMTVWPETADEYKVTFGLINDSYLDTVSRQMSTDETLTWSFTYDAVEGAEHLLLTGVDYPTGMRDHVEYSQSAGLQYPDAAGIGTRLPAVLSHIRSPGTGQPETVTYYEYTSQNFLGYNSNFGNWSADSDYIYTTLTDYRYGSTETVSDGDVTVSTTRTYNNYHLQVSEETTRQGCTYRTDFNYYAEADTFIDGQPPQFQLPKQKTETWTDAQGKSRAQVTVSEFDESGNPTRQVSPDGTETVTEWYSAAGGNGCPAEPNGFVRFMKSQTIMPRQTDYIAPVMQTTYTYKTTGDSGHIVADTVTQSADGVLLQKRCYSYNLTAGDMEYGRMTGMTDEIWSDGEGSASFTATQTFTSVVSNGVLQQTRVFTGHDALQATTSRAQSAYSGLVLSETDAQGVTTTYTYDKCGRLLSRTLTPGTDYENTTTWRWINDNSGPVTIRTDASGNQLRTYFDGSGRPVRVQRFDRDDTQKWFDVLLCNYNALGEAVTGMATDWFTDANERYEVDTRISRSGWGALSTQIFSDGTQIEQGIDPIGLLQRVSQKGGTALSTGTLTTTFDETSYLPVTKTRTNTAGQIVGECLNDWDGLGRLCTETDERGNQTVRTYDAYDRVLTQKLADGSVVTRTYAPHLTGDQVASISVTGPDRDGTTRNWLLGTQDFDSLGRLTRRVSGGRTTTYTYDGASPVPSSVTLSSDNVLNYNYIPELGNVVSSLTADSVMQAFSYDNSTGDLLTAKEGSTEDHHTWSPSGSLAGETFSRDGEKRQAGYTYTLSGKLASCTDISGARTTSVRDKYGRVIALTDDALTVSLKYDALSRLSVQTATDSATQASLTTEFRYDDFDREVARTITDSSGVTLTLRQTWLPNDLLSTRTTQRDGSVVKDEAYSYDARNRLISYTVTGDALPEDAYGHKMKARTYKYDALNNLIMVTTTLADGSIDTATYHYENSNDPTQLSSVMHTHADYPQTITLKYDADGRMTQDEAGRALGYDAVGRLVSVSGNNISGGGYGYDALNRLVSQNVTDGDTRQLYYRADELVNEVLVQQNRATRLVKNGHTCLGVSDDSALTLTAADHNDSLLWSRDVSQKEGLQHNWSPYGNGKTTDLLPGFNGERTDPVSGASHLGNGYRAYNPVLMRFNCPDSLSPFGGGGINPYAYCAGDPVNHTDPSGHLSGQAITGIVTGALGLAFSVFTAGASIAAAGGVMAALGAASTTSLVVGGLGVAADVTAIASGAAEDANPQAASVLGWVSLGSGVVGLATAIAPLASRGIKKVGAFAGDWQYRLQHAGGKRTLGETIESASERGRTLIGYHGTSSKFEKSLLRGINYEAFAGAGAGSRHGQAFYAALDIGTAEGYARMTTEKTNRGRSLLSKIFRKKYKPITFEVFFDTRGYTGNFGDEIFANVLYQGRGPRPTSYEVKFTGESVKYISLRNVINTGKNEIIDYEKLPGLLRGENVI